MEGLLKGFTLGSMTHYLDRLPYGNRSKRLLASGKSELRRRIGMIEPAAIWTDNIVKTTAESLDPVAVAQFQRALM